MASAFQSHTRTGSGGNAQATRHKLAPIAEVIAAISSSAWKVFTAKCFMPAQFMQNI